MSYGVTEQGGIKIISQDLDIPVDVSPETFFPAYHRLNANNQPIGCDAQLAGQLYQQDKL